MKVLIDANILLRVAQPAIASHATSLAALTQLANADFDLCLVPQSIYEYWVVATRPVTVNGLGLTIPVVDQQIQDLLSRLTLLRDERGIFAHWYELVVRNAVHGKLAHDTRMVAAMQRHGLTNLLTFSKPDFSRFVGIQVLTPDDVLSGQMPT